MREQLRIDSKGKGRGRCLSGLLRDKWSDIGISLELLKKHIERGAVHKRHW